MATANRIHARSGMRVAFPEDPTLRRDASCGQAARPGRPQAKTAMQIVHAQDDDKRRLSILNTKPPQGDACPCRVLLFALGR
jgi:hypothetical protein